MVCNVSKHANVRKKGINSTLSTNRFPLSTFRKKQDIFLFSGSSIFSGGRKRFLYSTPAQKPALKPKHCPPQCSFSLLSNSLNIQHPYPATASPSRFHTHPGWLTSDEQTTNILREVQQIYHMIYLYPSRKINQKRCHCSVLRVHERHETTHSIQASTTFDSK